MIKRRVFFDLDGTLAEWRGGARREELLEKGYFISLRPIPEMIEAARRVNENEDLSVYILSKYWTCGDFALPEKIEWCEKYLPFIPKDHLLFVPDETEKAEFVKRATGEGVTPSDVLVDDYTKNLYEWMQNGGTGVKCINEWNDRTKKFVGLRVRTADDVMEALCGLK